MQVIATRLTQFSLAFTLFLSAPAAQSKLLPGADAASWRAQGFQQSFRGDKDQALQSYQHAIDTALHEYGPDSSYVAQLYYERGALALDAKKSHIAATDLQKAVQQNPNSIMARVKFAEALQLTGSRDEAYQQIQAALAKHPNSSEAREALVLWWQSKAKEDGLTDLAKNIYNSRAIQESTNLGQALRRSAAQEQATPVLATVAPKPLAPAAKPPNPEPATPASVVSAAPAPAKPLFGFPWMRPKSPEPKKEEKPLKPPTAKEVKKEPKQEPKSKKEKIKKAKPEKEPKPVVPTPAPQPEAKTALVTSARALPRPKAESPAKKVEGAAKKTDTDEIQAPDQPAPKKEEKKEEKPQVAQPVQPVRYIPMGQPINTGNKKPRTGFVPPPPPMTPSFPGAPMMYAPPPQAVQPKPEPPKAKPKEKPKESPKEESKSSGGSEDPDFILEWAGKKKK